MFIKKKVGPNYGKYFIARAWDRTPHDDWTLRVQVRMGKDDGAEEVYDDASGVLIGWAIKPLYE